MFGRFGLSDGRRINDIFSQIYPNLVWFVSSACACSMSLLRSGMIRSIGKAGCLTVERPSQFDGNETILRSRAVFRTKFCSPKATAGSFRLVCGASVRSSSTMAPIELYSLATPNGQKIGVALEEMGLEYNPHTLNIMKNEQFTPEFIAINPNSKIPAIVDPDGPDGKPINVFESGAILVYLAEKSGKFLPSDPRLKSETLQWLFFQMGGVGPMFGQFGHFYKFGKDKCKDPYPVERYANEAKRLLGVLEKRLEGTEYLVGNQYTIADMATFPWVNALTTGLDATEYLGLSNFPNVEAWRDRCSTRPATAKGLKVCSFG